jgi:hypothetical protein
MQYVVMLIKDVHINGNVIQFGADRATVGGASVY